MVKFVVSYNGTSYDNIYKWLPDNAVMLSREDTTFEPAMGHVLSVYMSKMLFNEDNRYKYEYDCKNNCIVDGKNKLKLNNFQRFTFRHFLEKDIKYLYLSTIIPAAFSELISKLKRDIDTSLTLEQRLAIVYKNISKKIDVYENALYLCNHHVSENTLSVNNHMFSSKYGTSDIDINNPVFKEGIDVDQEKLLDSVTNDMLLLTNHKLFEHEIDRLLDYIDEKLSIDEMAAELDRIKFDMVNKLVGIDPDGPLTLDEMYNFLTGFDPDYLMVENPIYVSIDREMSIDEDMDTLAPWLIDEINKVNDTKVSVGTSIDKDMLVDEGEHVAINPAARELLFNALLSDVQHVLIEPMLKDMFDKITEKLVTEDHPVFALSIADKLKYLKENIGKRLAMKKGSFYGIEQDDNGDLSLNRISVGKHKIKWNGMSFEANSETVEQIASPAMSMYMDEHLLHIVHVDMYKEGVLELINCLDVKREMQCFNFDNCNAPHVLVFKKKVY